MGDPTTFSYLPLDIENMSFTGELYGAGNTSEQWTNSSNTTDTGLPSGYSTLHITLTCIVVIIIMLEIILGNILVIMAIVKDKNLKARQNWLIASLSVADLCVGSLIMPFSLAYELMGYWPFGLVVCDVWLIIDVMLCTSSVLNLCVISLDRYWCVTRPLTYPQKRTAKRMALMIALSWGLSGLICLPPLFGWKSPQPEQEYPQCFLSQELGYILYSISGSFLVPLIITCVVYAKVLHVARTRARRNVPKKKDKHVVDNDKPTQFMIKDCSSSSSDTTDKNVKEHDKNGNRNQNDIQETDITAITKGSEEGNNTETKHQPLLAEQSNAHNPEGLESQQSTVELKDTRCPLVCCSFRKREKIETKSSLVRTSTVTDNQKMKRKIAKARERRATVTVGLIVFSFALCWLPFSISYVIDSIGNFGFQYTRVFTVFFWLGYVNSGINPLLYTFFNRDFRTAFKKILHLQ